MAGATTSGYASKKSVASCFLFARRVVVAVHWDHATKLRVTTIHASHTNTRCSLPTLYFPSPFPDVC